jgi:hypothetical protein
MLERPIYIYFSGTKENAICIVYTFSLPNEREKYQYILYTYWGEEETNICSSMTL